jgi:hypothetical protein
MLTRIQEAGGVEEPADAWAAGRNLASGACLTEGA